MNKFLKQHLVENFGLAADASDDTAKSLLKEKMASDELSLEKYDELMSKKADAPKEKAAELADSIAEKTTKGVVDGLGGKFDMLIGALTDKQEKSAPAEKPEPKEVEEPQESLKEMEARLMKSIQEKYGDKPVLGNDGGDALKMWDMAYQENENKDAIRVKSQVERWSHNRTAVVHKGRTAKGLGIEGQPILVNGNEVHHLTERTKWLSTAWAKFQLAPEHLNERETELVQWILHNEKFHTPWSTSGESKMLSESERMSVWHAHKGMYSKAVIDDTTSGGEYATPEFFDMDFITTPTLASENISQYTNMVSVPRGTAAQNFIMGRPTIAAANTEGSATSVFTTTGFISNHDTEFYRAAGFMELGRNFLEDAHPGVLMEVYNQYMLSVQLWLNEQIMAGDGTTEPEGVTVDTGTGDITPANPTTGALTLADALNMLFGVGKAYRERGGRNNAIYCMTDQTYKLFRSIATGVTGDTRLVFGDSVEDYTLFGHPVVIEENGLSNSDAVFFQAKGYRLYQRQGARMIREDRGDALVRKNVILAGVDVRYGGQLDEPGYAAVVDSFPS